MTRQIHLKSTKRTSTDDVTFFSRDAVVILKLLENAAKTLGLSIRYEPIFQNGEPWQSDGGLCRILAENLIIINALAPPEQKCQVILSALKRHQPDPSLLPPAVRQMLK